MLFVVLAQNEYGLRDAWYVNGDNMVEAMKEASEIMINANICPAMVTLLPTKETRFIPYLFPNDPNTDTTLVLDFLRGYTRTVRLSHKLMKELEQDEQEYNVEVKRESEPRILKNMRRFLHDEVNE